MIDAEKRQAILALHAEGVSIREMAVKLRLSRNTVRAILKSPEPSQERPAARKVDFVESELLARLYVDCDGWVQRIHEKLTTEENIQIGYSTLTKLIRKLGLGAEPSRRHDQRDDVPGAEMQHDTSPYVRDIGGKPTGIIASLLYYRYSKQRYLQFYPSFNRFRMKCFFFEALKQYQFVAKVCIIDNTNLAVLRGTGKNAVMVPEMAVFAKQFGFDWLAHEKGHSNRKAGEERSFWTVETNFFPGRAFKSMEDLNAQALHWSVEHMAGRAQTDFKIIPREYWEREKPHLEKIPPYVAEPYLEHHRGIDQYGRAPFDANSYWVPGAGRGQVMILQYSNRIKIYQDRVLLIEYPLPAHGTRNQKFKPPGITEVKQPSLKSTSMDMEEAKLRQLAPAIGTFLDFALQDKNMRGNRTRLIHELYRLQARMARALFIQTIERATSYRVTDPGAIERIAVFLLRDELFDAALPETPSKFQGRDLYREGRLSADPDLSIYQDLLKAPDDEPPSSDDENDPSGTPRENS